MEQNKIELLFFVGIFCLGLFLWSLPITDMPFGDVDSSFHFTSGDYMAQNDRSLIKFPYYYGGSIATSLTGGYFAYPPQFNAGEAIIQVIGGHRIISIYLFIAFLCISFSISSYLLIRKLYGFIPGILTLLFIITSRRDIMYYLWGLWPQTIAFSFVPVVAYCFYRYAGNQMMPNDDGQLKSTIKYLYLTMIFIAIQYTFHQQAFFFSAAFLVIYTAALIIIRRKLPFKIKDISLSILVLAILITILAPFQLQYTFSEVLLSGSSSSSVGGFGFKSENISRLFHWFKTDQQYLSAVPENYFWYSYIYGGYWTLPLLLLGLVYVILKRRPQDILLLSLLFTLYLFIHMEIIGGERNFRFLQLEAQIFTPIIVLGLLSLSSYIKIPQFPRNYVKYALIILFITLTLYFNVHAVYNELSNSYKGITRITQPEYDATVWMKDNLPEKANFILVGTVAYNKKKWIQNLAYKYSYYDGELVPNMKDAGPEFKATHAVIDYSDLAMIGRNDIVQQLETWEKESLANATILYNKNNVKVYDLETKSQ